ncbi:uncharacterized protein LOC123559660 [Mercenaria mercenaria]|uniref:uncharacterized protein LOC123559660 n=1 Tax=Mercenaria mercenaria TaxID=6596 RepID=UPI00234EAF5B|nr:uncharacterized protein LOC123559660 [Mercenaria mercenaria]
MKVAKSGKTLLTPIMIEEITDPMSITMAATHFSEAVEAGMRNNGDIHSAELCKEVRQWWESEDKPGISASERYSLRRDLRKRLLECVDFKSFPPPTSYVRGWPIQLWEALLANMDAKAYLYTLCRGETYNVRAFSSMIGETFFSEVTLNDRRGQGTVSCKEFGQFIGNALEQVQIRLDPDRKFSYNTCRSTVYNLVEKAEPEHTGDVGISTRNTAQNNLPDNITLKSHTFDMPERGRLAGKNKCSTVSLDRNSLQKGSLGVRWEKARTNESKMLPSQRMGIQYDQNETTVLKK